MTTIFDTSALVAVLKPSDEHHRWCVDQLEARKADGPVLIIDIIYSELSVTMSRDEMEAAMARLAVDRLPSTDEALFRAGKAFLRYRERDGTKTNVLPDFLIGAAADAAGIRLVTTNPKDFVGYFPGVEVIDPATSPATLKQPEGGHRPIPSR